MKEVTFKLRLSEVYIQILGRLTMVFENLKKRFICVCGRIIVSFNLICFDKKIHLLYVVAGY